MVVAITRSLHITVSNKYKNDENIITDNIIKKNQNEGRQLKQLGKLRK